MGYPDLVDSLTHTSAGIGPQTARAVRLVVLSASDERQCGTAVMVDRPLTFGRRMGDGIFHLDDDEVSRQHCIVETVEDSPDSADQPTYRLRDLGSRNHTYVNGVRVDEHALRHGDVIRTGRCLVLFECLELDPRESLAPEVSGLRGQSVAMSRIRGVISDVAPRAIPVLILGESGAGKERVAELVHERSGREGAFVPVNCAAIPENLFESELFGHTAGAFTGAAKAKDGLFVSADGGTLFLDELGEMPMPLQAKLLRVLADGEIRPIGANASRKVDVRILAATNVDIEKAIADERLRGDLYARLSGWTLRLPPLRERRDDILPLARHFLVREGAPKGVTFSANAAEAMLAYAWPFNVRELEQAMGASVIRLGRSGTDCVELSDLPREVRAVLAHRIEAGSAEVPLALRVNPGAVPSAEELRQVLDHFSGNVVQVASFFGRDRRQIYRWAEQREIDLSSFRSDRADI